MDVEVDLHNAVDVKYAAIAELKKTVNDYARKIELLMIEIFELRKKHLELNSQKVSSLDDDLRLPPRKVAKSVISFKAYNKNNKSSLPSDAVIVAVTSKKVKVIQSQRSERSLLNVKNKKKTFQVNNANAIAVRESILADMVRAVFKEKSASFHDDKLVEEKMSCYLIKGLVGFSGDELKDIKQQLINLGLPSSIDLSFHVTGHMRKNKNKVMNNTLVKLLMPPNVDVNKLYAIKSLNYVTIKFEQFTNK